MVSIIIRALKGGVSLVHVHLIFGSAIAWTDRCSLWYIQMGYFLYKFPVIQIRRIYLTIKTASIFDQTVLQ